MKIKFIGHSCFLITSDSGTRIITDPYEAGAYDGAVKYKAIEDEADLVLISHEHPDHNSPGSVPGDPTVINTAGDHLFNGITVKGVPAYHDTEKGAQRGEIVIFSMKVDGVNIVHSGDLGHTLGDDIVSAIGQVDVLLLAVGGFFTVGSEELDQVLEALQPGLVIPMHYKTDGVDFPIALVDDFLEGRENVTLVGDSEIDMDASSPPQGIVVLEPSALP
jgi:L-ascorbate metabolism protein UlaG (beta-lactamase superfamily)